MYKYIRDIKLDIDTDVDWKLIKGPNSDYQTFTIKLDAVAGKRVDFARLIKLPPSGFIPKHSDNGGRKEGIKVYHIVLETNPKCRNVSYTVPIQVVHMPVNTMWLFDTWPAHESWNNGKTDRIHLVIDSYD